MEIIIFDDGDYFFVAAADFKNLQESKAISIHVNNPLGKIIRNWAYELGIGEQPPPEENTGEGKN